MRIYLLLLFVYLFCILLVCLFVCEYVFRSVSFWFGFSPWSFYVLFTLEIIGCCCVRAIKIVHGANEPYCCCSRVTNLPIACMMFVNFVCLYVSFAKFFFFFFSFYTVISIWIWTTTTTMTTAHYMVSNLYALLFVWSISRDWNDLFILQDFHLLYVKLSAAAAASGSFNFRHTTLKWMKVILGDADERERERVTVQTSAYGTQNFNRRWELVTERQRGGEKRRRKSMKFSSYA